MTHDMGQGTPLAQDQYRRFQTLGAEQNTAEEVPHRVDCGDTASKEDKEKPIIKKKKHQRGKFKHCTKMVNFYNQWYDFIF